MYLLGIDYGTARVGLSFCDTEIGVVLPYGTVHPEDLASLIKEERIQQLVMGVPLAMDGSETDHTTEIRRVGDALSEQTGCAISYVDERFTSQLADRMHGGVGRDEKAAMVILETFLQTKK